MWKLLIIESFFLNQKLNKIENEKMYWNLRVFFMLLLESPW
jgi:hypothetical protein